MADVVRSFGEPAGEAGARIEVGPLPTVMADPTAARAGLHEPDRQRDQVPPPGRPARDPDLGLPGRADGPVRGAGQRDRDRARVLRPDLPDVPAAPHHGRVRGDRDRPRGRQEDRRAARRGGSGSSRRRARARPSSSPSRPREPLRVRCAGIRKTDIFPPAGTVCAPKGRDDDSFVHGIPTRREIPAAWVILPPLTLDAIREPAFLHDADGRVVAANPSAERLAGGPPADSPSDGSPGVSSTASRTAVRPRASGMPCGRSRRRRSVPAARRARRGGRPCASDHHVGAVRRDGRSTAPSSVWRDADRRRRAAAGGSTRYRAAAARPG